MLCGLLPSGRVLGYRRGQLASETPDQRTSRLDSGRLRQALDVLYVIRKYAKILQ